jgi:hypothetical protein
MFNFIIQRRAILVLALLFTVCALTRDIAAQSSAQERASALRAQLVEVLTKQQSLQARLQNLEEELKPENIEKSLAGIGQYASGGPARVTPPPIRTGKDEYSNAAQPTGGEPNEVGSENPSGRR